MPKYWGIKPLTQITFSCQIFIQFSKCFFLWKTHTRTIPRIWPLPVCITVTITFFVSISAFLFFTQKISYSHIQQTKSISAWIESLPRQWNMLVCLIGITLAQYFSVIALFFFHMQFWCNWLLSRQKINLPLYGIHAFFSSWFIL